MSWCRLLPGAVSRQPLTLVAAGVLTLLASACNGSALPASPSPSAGASSSGAAAQPKVNRLVFTAGTPGRTDVDLRFLAEPYVWPWRATYDDLMAVDAKTGKLVPGLASSWSIEPDGTTFRVKLRDAEFHNGFGPVRAEDVKFGWEEVIKVDSIHGQQSYFQSIKGVEAASEKEVLFRMAKPDGIFVTAISEYQGGIEVRSKKSFEKQGTPNWQNGPLAGSGPYKYKEGAEGQFLRYERANNNHWTGTPEFPEFEWRFAKEASTRLAALLTGEAHMADLPSDLSAQAEKQGMKVIRGQFPGTRFWGSMRGMYVKDPNDPAQGFMYPDSPLMNIKVRQALNKAINRDEMNKAFFQGKAETMYLNHFHPTRLGYNKEWETKFPEMYGYDPAKAKQLLAEAGFASGLKMQMPVKVMPGVPGYGDLAEAVAGYWRAIGVTVSLEEVEVPRDRDVYSKFGYQSAVTLDASGSNQWSGSTIWYSSFTSRGNGTENPKTDALLKQIASTVDMAKQEELWRQVGDESYNSFMGVSLFWLPSEVTANPKVVGEWLYPGGITGAWTHIVNIKPAK